MFFLVCNPVWTVKLSELWLHHQTVPKHKYGLDAQQLKISTQDLGGVDSYMWEHSCRTAGINTACWLRNSRQRGNVKFRNSNLL